MKACSEQKNISLYLDGELTADQTAQFETHLQGCPGCREELAQHREIQSLLSNLPTQEVPEELTERLHAALMEEVSKGRKPMRRIPAALPLAAAICAGLIGGTILIGGALRLAKQNLNIANQSQMMQKADISASPADGGMSAAGITGGAGREDIAAQEEAGFDLADVAPQEERPAEAPDAAGMPEREESVDLSSAYSANRAAAPSQRKIIYNAGVSLETRDFDRTMAELRATVEQRGGHIEFSQSYGVPENAKEAGRSAYVTMRLPVEQYQGALDDLATLGNVLSRNESSEDVSRQYVDTEARNRTLIAQRDRLQELLAQADSIEAMIALESEIARVTTEIEQLTGQLNYWDNQVAYSTISVDVRELVTPQRVADTADDIGSRRIGAFYRSLNNMKQGLENFTVWLMSALPYLAIVLVLTGVAAVIAIPLVRRARRRAHKEE